MKDIFDQVFVDISAVDNHRSESYRIVYSIFENDTDAVTFKLMLRDQS